MGRCYLPKYQLDWVKIVDFIIECENYLDAPGTAEKSRQAITYKYTYLDFTDGTSTHCTCVVII